MRIEGISDARPYSLSNQVTKEADEKKVRSNKASELKATYTASVGGKEGLKDISLAEPTRFREAAVAELTKADTAEAGRGDSKSIVDSTVADTSTIINAQTNETSSSAGLSSSLSTGRLSIDV